MAAIPIWKDKIVQLSSSDVDFRITADGTVIYRGKAFKRPDASYAQARINDICADYLSHALPTLTDRTWTKMTLPSFVVQILSGSTWTNMTTVQFYPDWSYDYGFSGNALSYPINGHIDSRMFVMASVLAKSSPLTANYRLKSGSTTTKSISYTPSPGTGTGVFKANAVSNVARVTINGNEYYVVTDCAKYALYYVNAYGGWDQFLIEGNYLESDSSERYNHGQEYDNTSIVNAGTVNFVNEITKSWTLHSGWMSDEAGARMHHLLNSCLVYLCDIATQEFIPVIITNTDCDYKSYKNQGRTMVNYTITVELAQNRIRK